MSANNENNVIEFRKEGAIGVLTINNPPANALSFAVRKALSRMIPECMADDGITGLVLTGAGRMFMAGADISEFDLEPPAGVPDFHGDLVRGLVLVNDVDGSGCHGSGDNRKSGRTGKQDVFHSVPP